MVVSDPIDDQIHRGSFWHEIDDIPLSFWRFNPFGIATIQIPEFWRNVVSESIQSMPVSDFQYTSSSGSEELRRSILTNFAREAHLDPSTLSPDDNVACNLGGLGLIEAIIQLNIASKEHEAIFMEPFYCWHFTALKTGGKGKLTRLAFDPVTNLFKIDLAHLESLLTPNTRILVLCNPGNPSTRLFQEEEYAGVSKLLEKYPLVRVIEDCAYFCYTNLKDRGIKYFHEIGDNFKRTYTIFSGGKVFNATGVRLGWCFTDKTLGKELREYLWHYNMASALDRIKSDIDANEIVLFMKGTPGMPQCGFSATVVHILDHMGVKYKGVNVLADPEIRQGIKDFSNWPTIPQLYVKGEFVGGCDIVREMFESGELRPFMEEKGIKAEAP